MKENENDNEKDKDKEKDKEEEEEDGDNDKDKEDNDIIMKDDNKRKSVSGSTTITEIADDVSWVVVHFLIMIIVIQMIIIPVQMKIIQYK